MEKRKDERSERFYNLEGIGDTLIVALQDITLENRTLIAKEMLHAYTIVKATRQQDSTSLMHLLT